VRVLLLRVAFRKPHRKVNYCISNWRVVASSLLYFRGNNSSLCYLLLIRILPRSWVGDLVVSPSGYKSYGAFVVISRSTERVEKRSSMAFSKRPVDFKNRLYYITFSWGLENVDEIDIKQTFREMWTMERGDLKKSHIFSYSSKQGEKPSQSVGVLKFPISSKQPNYPAEIHVVTTKELKSQRKDGWKYWHRFSWSILSDLCLLLRNDVTSNLKFERIPLIASVESCKRTIALWLPRTYPLQIVVGEMLLTSSVQRKSVS